MLQTTASYLHWQPILLGLGCECCIQVCIQHNDQVFNVFPCIHVSFKKYEELD